MCIDAASGIVAVFTTLLSIAVLSCCMVAFRAALFPIQQTRPARDEDAEDSMVSEPGTDPCQHNSNTLQGTHDTEQQIDAHSSNTIPDEPIQGAS